MSLALCPQVVSQASQHFRSSKNQATCEGCFACQSICSVMSLHSDMSASPSAPLGRVGKGGVDVGMGLSAVIVGRVLIPVGYKLHFPPLIFFFFFLVQNYDPVLFFVYD